MIFSSALVFLVAVINSSANRYLPAKLKLLAPSIGWFITSVFIARGPFVWYACSLTIQGLFATLLFMTLGFTSSLALRAIIFPFLATAAAAWAKKVLPPVEAWATASIALVQIWSTFGGLIIHACYPANILQILEQQGERNRRVRSVAGTLVRKQGKSVEGRTVPSLDGKSTLQTLVVKQAYTTPRWVLYCGGNAEFLENSLKDIHVISDALKAHAILYNPRGIGYSTGYLSHLGEFVEDAAAVARAYIEEEKIDEKHLLFFGHSIGGGTAAQVVAECYPHASLVLDRTFSSMSDAAVAFSCLTPTVTRMIFPWFVGNLHTLVGWDKIKHSRKLVLYSQHDEMINFSISSIARHSQFQKGGADADKVVELLGAPPSYHNSLLNTFDNYEEVCLRMNWLFPT
ncbi:conserved hypothetical protein [Leishmania braziliensis MHOM/BR/75/M2904]|uniref:AB hydrolase-1 domain-containing protein n=2 Tax=Leishmania braziliensis TaxID=5660 RepID=A4HMU6_LEIBR|nr:conserved hypothetical protein [Leishmania braziliensis MHOM/BR/75/M2904]CAJ2480397.1 unnamed protein product [Leishmania braziliensis]CAJ2480838.1 unnamed protein product [Leishmania braziliensis]CAM43487.1 conserved hypothetical protein [Leishmania braziliensis MHOM/BR/75/M2904]SYZ69561.1 Chlamydia_CHLPS_protein_(DUF818)/alpha/beta_hydrolase_fold [Leishmania braziliensis MHOM/BR/75/M2904]